MVRMLTCMVLMLGLSSTAFGQDAKDAEEKEIKIESTLKKDAKKCSCRACGVNLAQELGVPLDYLSTLGARIHTARLSPDPVDLALAAQGLAVAEKVAGKKASITSDEVMDEAVALAKQRGISVELAAMKSIATDEKDQQEFAKLGKEAEAREAEVKQSVESGERTKALFGRLTVINHSPECLRIYVSGRYAGEVHAGQVAAFHVHDHNFHTELTAICEIDGDLVSAACSEGHRHSYVWHIH